MYLITGITDAPLQTLNLVLPNGNTASMTLYFVPMQLSWVMTNLTYGTFVLNGYKIVNSPNLLLQFQNIIPFGMACFSTNNRDPQLQEDFSSGASVLYILDQSEVASFYASLQAGTTGVT